MKKLNRRSFLQVPFRASTGLPAVSGTPDAAVEEGTSRRAFLQGTAGAAAGAAVILATPKVASIALDAPGRGVPAAVVTKASGPAPKEPITAYVHNADRGEVTVLSGTKETTYKDPALVKRLLDAAH